MTDCTATACGTPTTGESLCEEHVIELDNILAAHPALMVHVHESLTKQVRYSEVGGTIGTQDDGVVPFNVGASKVVAEASRTICKWQARIADRLGVPVRYPNAGHARRWISEQFATDRLHSWLGAGDFLQDMTDLRDNILQVIDRPDTAWYAGQCGDQSLDNDDHVVVCDRELYVSEKAGIIECPRCGARFDVTERRATLMREANNALATTVEISRAITVWTTYDRGEAKLSQRIRKWRERGRLAQRGTTIEHGVERPIYRVGDVLDLLTQDDARQEARDHKRAKTTAATS